MSRAARSGGGETVRTEEKLSEGADGEDNGGEEVVCVHVSRVHDVSQPDGDVAATGVDVTGGDVGVEIFVGLNASPVVAAHVCLPSSLIGLARMIINCLAFLRFFNRTLFGFCHRIRIRAEFRKDLPSILFSRHSHPSARASPLPRLFSLNFANPLRRPLQAFSMYMRLSSPHSLLLCPNQTYPTKRRSRRSGKRRKSQVKMSARVVS
eukprot:CAMPEP_0170187468 /NCGR_PEP_ID=MMETSP0040_2-20121228/41800_1 /TAXON_ID=641309 /ORGANISM="Lotharella oceanica, Strain CCMP622" /LENGTH=207 /DNA_ID=CAMNT_0010434507 /DNA_START=128 /DNA_END=749 /DNA_ORIENTATION=+